MIRRLIRGLLLAVTIPMLAIICIPMWKTLDWAFGRKPNDYWQEFWEYWVELEGD